MPRGRPKKNIEQEVFTPEVLADETTIPITIAETPKVSEKEHLLALYKELKDLGVYILSNLENRIARAE